MIEEVDPGIGRRMRVGRLMSQSRAGSSGASAPAQRLESGQACCQLLIPQSQSLRRHLPSVSRCRSQTARIFAEDVVQLR